MADKYYRLVCMVVNICHEPLREFFLKLAKSDPAVTAVYTDLGAYLILRQPQIAHLKTKKIIRQDQYDLVFPSAGIANIYEWDVTLLVTLTKNLFRVVITPLEEFCLEEIRKIRNDLQHIPNTSAISDGEFDNYWNRLEKAAKTLAREVSGAAYESEIGEKVKEARYSNMPSLGNTLRIFYEEDRKEMSSKMASMEETIKSLEAKLDEVTANTAVSSSILSNVTVTKSGPNGEKVKRFKAVDDILHRLIKQLQSTMQTELHELFTPPTEIAEIEAKLNDAHHVIVTGARNSPYLKTALHVIRTRAYNLQRCVEMNDASDWRHIDPDEVDLVLIKDPFGSYCYDEKRAKSILNIFDSIYRAVKPKQGQKTLDVILVSDFDYLNEVNGFKEHELLREVVQIFEPTSSSAPVEIKTVGPTSTSTSSNHFVRQMTDIFLSHFSEDSKRMDENTVKAAKEKLKRNKRLVIMGPAECGKTSLAVALAKSYAKDEVLMFSSPDKIETIDFQRTSLVIIDDFVGKYGFQRKKVIEWFQRFDQLYMAVTAGKLNIIVTCETSQIEKCNDEIKSHPLLSYQLVLTKVPIYVKQECSDGSGILEENNEEEIYGENNEEENEEKDEAINEDEEEDEEENEFIDEVYEKDVDGEEDKQTEDNEVEEAGWNLLSLQQPLKECDSDNELKGSASASLMKLIIGPSLQQSLQKASNPISNVNTSMENMALGGNNVMTGLSSSNLFGLKDNSNDDFLSRVTSWDNIMVDSSEISSGNSYINSSYANVTNASTTSYSNNTWSSQLKLDQVQQQLQRSLSSTPQRTQGSNVGVGGAGKRPVNLIGQLGQRSTSLDLGQMQGQAQIAQQHGHRSPGFSQSPGPIESRNGGFQMPPVQRGVMGYNRRSPAASPVPNMGSGGFKTPYDPRTQSPMLAPSPDSSSSLVTMLKVEQFTTKQDLRGKIIGCDISGITPGRFNCPDFVGQNIQEFCHSKDLQQLLQHLQNVAKYGSNTSGVYRFKMQENRYAFVQTKSKLFQHRISGSSEFIMSTHSIIRECDSDNELKGSASASLMKSIIGPSLQQLLQKASNPISNVDVSVANMALGGNNVMTGLNSSNLFGLNDNNNEDFLSHVTSWDIGMMDSSVSSSGNANINSSYANVTHVSTPSYSNNTWSSQLKLNQVQQQLQRSLSIAPQRTHGSNVGVGGAGKRPVNLIGQLGQRSTSLDLGQMQGQGQIAQQHGHRSPGFSQSQGPIESRNGGFHMPPVQRGVMGYNRRSPAASPVPSMGSDGFNTPYDP